MANHFRYAYFDETHSHKSPDLARAMAYNTDARKNGLVVVFSTCGNDTTHFYYTDYYQKSKRILSGEDVDVTWYCQVWEADPQSDYEKDESQWYKANPSLGTAFSLDQFRRQLQSAKGSLGTWLNFQRLKLNLWVRPDEHAWIDVSDWERFKVDTLEDGKLASLDAWIGVDLSETMDPTSVSIVFDLGDRKYFVRSWSWVAEAGLELRHKTTLTRFEEFVHAGHMTVTPGDMIDPKAVKDKILELCQTYNVRQVLFDPRGAYVLAHLIEEEGYDVTRVVQSARNYHGVMTEFIRAYKEGRIVHDGSSWIRYCLSNVRVEVNKFGEVRPYRKKSVDFIDGAISTLLGCYSAFTNVESTKSEIRWV